MRNLCSQRFWSRPGECSTAMRNFRKLKGAPTKQPHSSARHRQQCERQSPYIRRYVRRPLTEDERRALGNRQLLIRVRRRMQRRLERVLAKRAEADKDKDLDPEESEGESDGESKASWGF